MVTAQVHSGAGTYWACSGSGSGKTRRRQNREAVDCCRGERVWFVQVRGASFTELLLSGAHEWRVTLASFGWFWGLLREQLSTQTGSQWRASGWRWEMRSHRIVDGVWSHGHRYHIVWRQHGVKRGGQQEGVEEPQHVRWYVGSQSHWWHHLVASPQCQRQPDMGGGMHLQQGRTSGLVQPGWAPTGRGGTTLQKDWAALSPRAHPFSFCFCYHFHSKRGVQGKDFPCQSNIGTKCFLSTLTYWKKNMLCSVQARWQNEWKKQHSHLQVGEVDSVGEGFQHSHLHAWYWQPWHSQSWKQPGF
jgi:hypothetical protein